MASEEISGIVETLHPLERKILPYLADGASVEEIVKKSRLKEVEVMRALQWLENKKLVEKVSSAKSIIELDKNGIDYMESGLPERRFLDAIKDSANGLSFDEIQKKADLDREEFNVCIGVLKRKAAINVDGNRIKILAQGKELLGKRSLEEIFIEKLSNGGIEITSLKPEEKFAHDSLKKRKGIIKEKLLKLITINVTPLGKKVKQGSEKEAKAEFVDRLTPEILKDSSWKGKRFRKYDIKINVPNIYGGRRHFVSQTIDYIKRVWLDMGFGEMQGPMLNTSFWNFD